MVMRGEVWWREAPAEKRRPVVVLTRDGVVDRLTTITVAFITTVERGIPTEVRLDENDGMPRPCVVNLDNVNATSKSYLTQRVTRLDANRMHEICGALALAAGC